MLLEKLPAPGAAIQVQKLDDAQEYCRKEADQKVFGHLPLVFGVFLNTEVRLISFTINWVKASYKLPIKS